VEGTHVGNVVHPAHFGREEPLRRDQFELCARIGDELGRRHGLVPAIVVVEQHGAGRLGGSRDDVPARRHEIVASVERWILRHAACGDDHDVGAERQHVGGFREDIVADRDAEALEFGHAPVDDADEFAPPWVARGEQNLAARLRRCFQHRDAMAALR
jgi:hypothetical protein